MPIIFSEGTYAGMAWMKDSRRGCRPGLGGISVRPSPFSLNTSSTARMIPEISGSREAMSPEER